jgi:hypothetical protein
VGLGGTWRASIERADLLFGAGARSERFGRRWVGGYLALAGVLALVIVARRPDSVLRPQFWAEDGSVFFYEQLTLGFWVALRRLHGGLPYLAARLVAALGSVAPTAATPLVYTTSSIAVTSLAAATFSLPSFRHLVQRDILRVAVCVAAVCLPAGQDLLTVPCSLGYFVALWLIFLSVMPTPRTRVGTGAWCIGGALGVLSAHAAPIAAPLWLLRAVRGVARRQPRDVCFATTQLVVLLLVIGLAHTDWNATKVAGSVPFFDVQNSYLRGALRALVPAMAITVDAALLPATTVRWLQAQGELALAAPAATASAAVALTFGTLASRGRVTVSLAAYLFVSSLFLILVGRPIIVQVIEGTVPELSRVGVLDALGTRHRALPNLALLLLAAGVVDAAQRQQARVAAAVVTSTAFLFAWAPTFRIPPYPDLRWPVWAARLDHKLASGSHEPLVIPLHPAPFAIVFDSPRAPDTLRTPQRSGRDEHVARAASAIHAASMPDRRLSTPSCASELLDRSLTRLLCRGSI